MIKLIRILRLSNPDGSGYECKSCGIWNITVSSRKCSKRAAIDECGTVEASVARVLQLLRSCEARVWVEARGS